MDNSWKEIFKDYPKRNELGITVDNINKKIGVELSDIRRVSKYEYMENTADDDFEEEE